jgi:hypothetical protein
VTQSDYNLWSVILQGTGLVVSAVVAISVILYTKETIRIRTLSHRQLHLMEAQIKLGRDQLSAVARQIDLSVAPYLIAKAGTQSTAYGPRQGFSCTLKNITENIAHHIRVVIFRTPVDRVCIFQKRDLRSSRTRNLRFRSSGRMTGKRSFSGFRKSTAHVKRCIGY